MTTDSGSNMVKALELNKWTRLGCFGHRLHIAIEKRVQNEPWVSQATGVCKKVVSIFSYLWKKQKALTSTQDKVSLPLHKLITESPTVSRLQMMERVLVQEKAVAQVLATDKIHGTLHPPGKTVRSLNPSRQHLQDFTGFLECYLFNLYLNR